MRYIQSIVFLFLACAVSAVMALESPRAVIQGTVLKLQKEVSSQHVSLEQSPKKLYSIVQKVIMPSVDVNQMSALVLGPLWRGANAAERQEFVKQFSLLLTHTYANALITVSNYDVSVSPMRTDSWKHSRQAYVTGRVVPEGGGSASSVIYYLVRGGDSWKIYDFSIEGVSFVQNYRSQFSSFQNLHALNQRIEALNKKQAQ